MLGFFVTYLLIDTKGYVHEARFNVDTLGFSAETVHRLLGGTTP